MTSFAGMPGARVTVWPETVAPVASAEPTCSEGSRVTAVWYWPAGTERTNSPFSLIELEYEVWPSRVVNFICGGSSSVEVAEGAYEAIEPEMETSGPCGRRSMRLSEETCKALACETLCPFWNEAAERTTSPGGTPVISNKPGS